MPSQDQMIKVGECMANVDTAAMEPMERKSDAFEAELKRLCKAGLPMPQQRTVVPPEKLTSADIFTQPR